MQLSNNGKVIVIDNVFEEEGKPLLDALNKNNIPYFYFDGSLDALPEKPYKGIRFVFLDVELKGMEGKDVKTKASGVVGILEKIISKDNGPYVIVFWTKHPETIEQTIENCEKKGIKPILYIDLDKASCKEGDIYRLYIILNKLKEKAKDFGPYSLYIMWENIINNSGSQLVNNFAGIFPFDNDWSEKTEYLFYRLYKAYVEKNEVDNDLAKIGCVLQLLNRSFGDTIDNNIAMTKHDMATFDFLKSPSDPNIIKNFVNKINEIINPDIIARINNSLFVIDHPDILLYSGIVFEEDDENLKSILIEKCIDLNQDEDKKNVRLCKLIITPQCDICQNKAIKQRIVYGILFEENIGKCKKSGDLFPFNPFLFETKNFAIVFNFQAMEGVDSNTIEAEKILFGLRRDLLFDIQSKAADHVNRLGNLIISKEIIKKDL